MKFPVAAVAELLIAALYSSEHTFHVTYFSYGLMLMFCAHNLHPLNHSMATGQKGEKFELEGCVSSCLYLQHPGAQGKWVNFKTILSLKVSHKPTQLIEKYLQKNIVLKASFDLVHFSNAYKCDAFHSEGLSYSYFAL